jgi:hypothetical protein
MECFLSAGSTSIGGDMFRVSAGELGFFGEGFVEDR